MERRRQGVETVAVACLLHECHELLDEEGVSAAPLEQELDGPVVGVAAEQRAYECGSRVAVERVETQCQLVVLSRCRLPPVFETGAGRRDQHERPVV